MLVCGVAQSDFLHSCVAETVSRVRWRLYVGEQNHEIDSSSGLFHAGGLDRVSERQDPKFGQVCIAFGMDATDYVHMVEFPL